MNNSSGMPDFPPGFIWGVATSAYQIEGAAQEDGRGSSIWDSFSHTSGNIRDGSNGDIACDHYHRYQEDIDILARLGVKAYRFSMSWPRVQPLGYGDWNEAGFDFYSRLLDSLEQKGIAAHLTLYHWDLPQGLQDLDGWLNRDTCLHFAAYAAEVVSRFGHRLASVATHNEPWCSANLGYGDGQFAPGIADVVQAAQVSHHLLLSHGLAMQAMRRLHCPARLGIVLNLWPVTAATDTEADRTQAQWEYARSVQWFLDPIFKGYYPQIALDRMDMQQFHVQPGDMALIHQTLDFLGVNYYFRSYVSTEHPPRLPEGKLGFSDMGWEIYPAGLRDLLCQLHAAYPGLPTIFITENGIAVADQLLDGKVHDEARILYLQWHLQALHAAMLEGVDVQAYFFWSLLDNFEWNSGFAKRFGLVHVDYQTQKRTLKDSAYWYADFLKSQEPATSAQTSGQA